MKNLMRMSVAGILGLTLLGTMTSCGKTVKNYENVVVNENMQSFEGEYYLVNGGFIEIFQSQDSLYISSSGQLITTVNPENNTFGELPKITGEYKLNNNKVQFTRNLNYTSGMDIEEDTTGSNITGQRRTDISIELIEDKLQITYVIYSDRLNDNANFIVANRVITQE